MTFLRLFRTLILITTSCIVLFFFARCGAKDGFLDFIHIVPPQIDPEIALPLVDATLTVRDLIRLAGADNPNILLIERDGQMKLRFLGSQITKKASFFFKFDDIIPFNVENQAGFKTKSIYRPLNAKILSVQTALLKSGWLTYTITSNEDAEVLVTIPELRQEKDNYHIFEKEYELKKGEVRTEKIDMARSKIAIKNASQALEIGFAIQTTVSSGAVVKMEGQFENLEYTCAEGYLKESDYRLDQESNPLGIFEELKNGNLDFTSPSFILNMTNAFDIPFTISFDTLYAMNVEKKVFDLNTHDLILLKPRVVNTVFNSNRIDENIKNTLKGNPILLNSRVAIKTIDGKAKLYKVSATDSLKLRADLNLPLQFRSQKFEYFKEQENPLKDQEGIKNLELKVRTENNIPINIGLQIFFMDSKKDTLYKLFQKDDNFIAAAKVDTNGVNIGKTYKELLVSIPDLEMKKVDKAETMLMRVRMSTGDNGKSLAKMNLNQTVKIGIGVKAKL